MHPCRISTAVSHCCARLAAGTGVGATHVLLPAWCLSRRADAGEVIGQALEARAAGCGHRKIAERLVRPSSTVRGWPRAFARRAEQVRLVFTTLAASLVTDPPLPAPAGTRGGGCGGGGRGVRRGGGRSAGGWARWRGGGWPRR